MWSVYPCSLKWHQLTKRLEWECLDELLQQKVACTTGVNEVVDAKRETRECKQKRHVLFLVLSLASLITPIKSPITRKRKEKKIGHNKNQKPLTSLPFFSSVDKNSRTMSKRSTWVSCSKMVQASFSSPRNGTILHYTASNKTNFFSLTSSGMQSSIAGWCYV